MARSLLDLAHAVAGDRHDDLLAKLDRADRELGQKLSDGDVFTHELADTLVDEALEMLRGPRPNYGEAVTALGLAATYDERYRGHWRVVDEHYEEAAEEAMRRITTELEQSDREQERTIN